MNIALAASICLPNIAASFRMRVAHTVTFEGVISLLEWLCAFQRMFWKLSAD